MEKTMHIDQEFVGNLLSELNNRVVSITFTKADGSVRNMNCTLQSGIVPVVEHRETKDSTALPETLVVWDTDKSAWRSFRLDRLTHVN
jgi:hypothetical protein